MTTLSEEGSPLLGETGFVIDNLPNWRSLSACDVFRKNTRVVSSMSRSSRRGATPGLTRSAIVVTAQSLVGEVNVGSDRTSIPLTLSTLAENVGETHLAADISGILAHNRKFRQSTHPFATDVSTRTEVVKQRQTNAFPDLLACQVTTVSSMDPDSQHSLGSVDDMMHTHFMDFMRLYLCDYDLDGNLPLNWAALVVSHLASLKSCLTADGKAGLHSDGQESRKVTNVTSGRPNPRCDDITIIQDRHPIRWNASISSSLTRLRVADFILRELSLEYDEASLKDLKYSAPKKENISDAALKREGPDSLKPSEPTLNKDMMSLHPLTSSKKLAIPKLMLGGHRNLSCDDEPLSAELGTAPDTIRTGDQTGLQPSVPLVSDLMEDVTLQEELEESRSALNSNESFLHGSNRTSTARGGFQHSAVSEPTTYYSSDGCLTDTQSEGNQYPDKQHDSSGFHEFKPSLNIVKATPAHPGADIHASDEREDHQHPTPMSLESFAGKLYCSKRGCRRLYHDVNVHAAMIELLLILLVHVKPQQEEAVRKEFSSRSIDEEAQAPPRKHYLTQLHFENLVHDVPLLLRAHLNHVGNVAAVSFLVSKVEALGNDVERLLRLSCDAFFRPERYSTKTFVARGAFAEVYRCHLPYELGTLRSNEVAVKVIDLTQNVHDTLSATAVYSEIALLEALEREPFVAKLLDYGVSMDSFFIVMQHYPTSLKQWRTNHDSDKPGEISEASRHLLLYSAIYAQCLEAVAALERFGVVHYDIKADNFLLDPAQGCSVSEFWNPPERSTLSSFRIVITDFGESRLFAPTETAGTARNKGTEYIKAPEMLTVSSLSKIDATIYDRRKSKKCGHPSDIWALGCLLYEIIFNSFLLYEADWVHFFLRTVTPNADLLPSQSMKRLETLPAIKQFILWILVRDPSLRPKLGEVRTKFASLRMMLDPDVVSFSDEFASVCWDRSDSLWSVRAGIPVPLETRWPVEVAGSQYKPLSIFFPTTSNSGAEDKNVTCSLPSAAGPWRFLPGKIFRAFRSASRLDGVYIGDMDYVLEMSLQELNIPVIICTRKQSMDGISTSCSLKELSKIETHESKAVTSFTKRAAEVGISTHCVALPSISDFSLDAISSFAEGLRYAEHLFARTCGLETQNVCQLNDGQRDHLQHNRILIVCPSSDWTSALAVAAALHIYVKGGGVRAAALALSMPASFGAGKVMLHPTDAARLTAWEAREFADAALRNQSRSA
jgi:serine/threonine protein kinase